MKNVASLLFFRIDPEVAENHVASIIWARNIKAWLTFGGLVLS